MRDVFEIVARYLVPSIRRNLAIELVRRGMPEARVAEVLGVSRSAVTRYVKSERGVGVELSNFHDVNQLIKKVASEILPEKISKYQMQVRIAGIIAYVLSKKYFCRYHKKLDPTINISECMICPTIFNNIYNTVTNNYHQANGR